VRFDGRLVAAMLAPGLALAAWLAAGAFALRVALAPDQRAAVDAAIGPLVATHGMLAVAWWLGAAALAAWVAKRLYAAAVTTPARLADATRALAGAGSVPDIAPEGPAATRDLVAAINALASARRALAGDMARRVAEASAEVAHERDQLGALMAELDRSVVVCNLEGRILLYNARARQLFRRLSPAPQGAELIGLGRSIHPLVDRALIAHALETVERRIARGDASASARFVTAAAGGQLLHADLAPVRPSGEGGPPLTGYVLLLDDITDDYASQSRRDRQLMELTEAARASLAGMQAALDVLDLPDLKAAEREPFIAVVRGEVAAMSGRLAELAARTSHELVTRWPLEEMLGADLLAAAASRIEAETGRAAVTESEDGMWLYVDSFALVRVLAALAGGLQAGLKPAELRLRLAREGKRAHLDLVWPGDAALPEALRGWQTDPIRAGDAGVPLSVRDVVERHGGEVWVEADRANACAFFRFLLPLASGDPAEAADGGARPEFYDFDLFRAGAGSAADDRALGEIAYTVFDTETTGLDPAGGDEILQIGAVRIVNGKLLRGERFDQLVDPRRSIPEAGIPIHGIRPEMVRGQPAIEAVLPAFHAFASETVLVGHNVAFDLRFLALKEASSGVRFEQPVLDTLLLASVVHPGEAAHGLEAMAARLGVVVAGRHTALGDAVMTAEVFLSLLPLLAQRGIRTLGEARAAAQRSYYARLRY
jgi:DNA polymerase-3 subunit epsilon